MFETHHSGREPSIWLLALYVPQAVCLIVGYFMFQQQVKRFRSGSAEDNFTCTALSHIKLAISHGDNILPTGQLVLALTLER